MKTLVIVVSILVFSTGSSRAADTHVSQTSLAKMGLGEMHPISDSEGATIRGMPAFRWPIGVFPIPLLF